MKKPKPAKTGRPVKSPDGVASSKTLRLRVTPAREAAYKGAAGGPMKFSGWATKHLDRAAKYEPKKPES